MGQQPRALPAGFSAPRCIFWRRMPGGHGGKLEAVGARALSAKDADPLGDNIIHSVTNPIPRLTGEREDRGFPRTSGAVRPSRRLKSSGESAGTSAYQSSVLNDRISSASVR